MRRWGLAICLFVAGTVSALAAPPAPAVQWGGFYAGGAVGGVWNRPLDWTFPLAPALAPLPESHGNSWVGQVLLGYNFQFGQWVVGIEGNMSLMNLKTTAICPSGNICDQHTHESDMIGLRGGYAWANYLAFVSGGYAKTRIEANVFNVSNGSFADRSTTSNDSWYFGAGVEYALSSYLNVGVEYKHIEATRKSGTTFPILNDDRSVGDRIDMVTFRVTMPLSSLFRY